MMHIMKKRKCDTVETKPKLTFNFFLSYIFFQVETNLAKEEGIKNTHL